MFVRVAMIAVLLSTGLVPAAKAVDPQDYPKTEEEMEILLAIPNYARGGFFFAFEGLGSVENTTEIGGNCSLFGENCTTDSTQYSGGFDMRLGYRPNRWTATDLSGLYIYSWYESASGVKYLAWGMWLSQRFYFSKSRVQPYISAGLGFAQIRARSDVTTFDPKFAPVAGVGLEIYLSQTIAVTLVGNYYVPLDSSNTYPFATAGLGMMFY